MKKTATITWITWLNYGSYLQAYALQHVIRNLGYDNAIIDDERIVYPLGKPEIIGMYGFSFYKRMRYYAAKWIKNTDKRVMEERYKRFRRKHLVIDNSFNRLDELNQKYDIFIAGSDQIWAPTKEIFKPYYYLDFVTKKKISYAASVNSDCYPYAIKERVSELLKGFSHISVREEAGKRMLKSFVQQEIEVSVDPTLLLTSIEWQKVANKRRKNLPFILCYLLSYNEAYLQYANSFAKQRKLPLYIFSNNEQYRPYADKMLAAGPSEFVGSFRDATFIMTDSFHGTIFSILHEKDFITFKRFKGKESSNQNERLNNLFRITGIEGRFLNEQELFNATFAPIDYELVDSNLAKEREKAIIYLREALAG